MIAQRPICQKAHDRTGDHRARDGEEARRGEKALEPRDGIEAFELRRELLAGDDSSGLHGVRNRPRDARRKQHREGQRGDGRSKLGRVESRGRMRHGRVCESGAQVGGCARREGASGLRNEGHDDDEGDRLRRVCADAAVTLFAGFTETTGGRRFGLVGHVIEEERLTGRHEDGKPRTSKAAGAALGLSCPPHPRYRT